MFVGWFIWEWSSVGLAAKGVFLRPNRKDSLSKPTLKKSRCPNSSISKGHFEGPGRILRLDST